MSLFSSILGGIGSIFSSPLGGILGSVGSSLIGAHGATSAADAQAAAANNATQAQLQMYNQTRADQTPWRQAGGQAVSALSDFYGLNGSTPDYQKLLSGLPGYQFQMDQGNQAVQRNLAARGLLDSGAAGKALQQYGQGVASQYAGQYVNGLQSLAGLGQTSLGQTAAAGANAANGVASAAGYAGNAAAAGYAGQANAWQNGLGGLAGAAQDYYKNYYKPDSGSGYNGSGTLMGTGLGSIGAGSVFSYNPNFGP